MANQMLTVCFLALGTNSMFSRAWHWKIIFPRLALEDYFPALGTECMFFPRLALKACFPALGTGGMFNRYWFHVQPRLKQLNACMIAFFLVLSSD